MEIYQIDTSKDVNSKRCKQIQMIAFDLYGTLFNSVSGLTNSLFRGNKRLKNKFLTTDTNLDRSKIGKKLKTIFCEQLKNVFIFSDVLETINYLKNQGYKIAIISNLSSYFAGPIKCLIPEGLIDYKILSFEVGEKKPNPGIFEELKKQSGIDFDKVIMVGDSITSDIQGAKNVGMNTVYIDRKSEGIQYNKTYETIQISQISDLVELIDTMESGNNSIL